MNWKCPDDWKYMPKAHDASDGMMMSLLFGEHARFQHIRCMWFQRCNASGKWIWPLQKGWCGVVGVKVAEYLAYPDQTKSGSYKIVWLNEDQYLIQKLKGNI